MALFHVDAGNSNKGACGFCLEVEAANAQEALDHLKEVLPECFEERIGEERVIGPVRIYLSAHNLTLDDIEEWEDDNDADELRETADEEV